jgi:catechol 2,3-dioxygenase-like lactoylglutathione lyase family enzyme
VTLSGARVDAQIAVSDMARAREFYEGVLGLPPGSGPNEWSTTYVLGAATRLHLYEAPPHAGESGGTLARFDVSDIEAVVDELTGRGVTFRQFGEPVPTDAKGIHDSGYGKVAWFDDPDGNLFALEQV